MKVLVSGGEVKGRKEEKEGIILRIFRGIPYAKAQRFQRPQDVFWSGVLDCTAFGKTAIMTNDNVSPEEMSEDCLNLNVYCPDTEEENLAVLVDIHGGAFQNGCNRDRSPFRILKNKKFIYVSMNYRMGALGFLYLGDALGKSYAHTGNLGLLDILAALKWVQKNIGRFGGDPGRVTLMGTSAGAKAIGALMYRKEAKDLFSQTLLSSGAAQSIRSKATASKITNRFLNGRDAKDLLSMPVDEIRKMQQIFAQNDYSTCYFGPVADGVILTEDSWNTFPDTGYWRGKAMIGSCLHELTGYGEADGFLERVETLCDQLFGENAELAIETFEKHRGSVSDKELWVKILSDYMYRMYSYDLAEKMMLQGSDVWVYSMCALPAFHCMDQYLAFEAEKQQHPGEIIWDNYTDFVINGKPACEEWNTISQECRIQMIWDKKCRVEKYGKDETFHLFPKGVFI